MVDTKISNLPAVVTPAGADELPVNQGGTTKKLTITQATAVHEAASDPHPGYLTAAEGDAAYDAIGAAAARAPANADYLVGTANSGLSAEIAVGTSPGGELGGTWASPTVDASHSGSTHAATQAAAESTAASALTSHAGAADPHTGYLKESDVSGFAVPAVVLGTAAAAGAATTAVRTDATLLAFDATAPTTQAFSDSAAAGAATVAARRDHKHAWPALGTTAAAIGTSAGGSATTPSKSDHVHATGAGTPSTQAFGDAAATGTGPAAAMTDHKHAMPAAPTTIANDTLWAAAGDIAVATANDTAAVLSKGAAGGALSIINAAVAWNSGTSFPASKATGDRYWRTDLGMEFYWDGTQWVTTTLYHETFGNLSDNSGDIEPLPIARTGDVIGRIALWQPTYSILVVGVYFQYRVQTTNSGSHFWTMTVDFNGAPTIVQSTAANSADTTYATYVASGVATTTQNFARFYADKTGTPGSMFFVKAALVYRVIAT